VRLPEYPYAGADAVLVDDVASTGHTLAVAARALRQAGAGRVDVLVTHGLFVAGALALLEDAGVTAVWSSDSVSHPSNTFSLAPMLAEAVAGRATVARGYSV
jgi:ribose-phosphate pyrophosphokinase